MSVRTKLFVSIAVLTLVMISMFVATWEGKSTILLLGQGAAALVGLGCAGLALATTNSMIQRLQLIQGFADQLGSGNLNAAVGLGGSDELGAIGGCLDTTTAKLRGMFAGIGDNAEILGRNAIAFGVLSEQLLENTEGVNGKSNSVAAAAEQLSGNMAAISIAAADLNGRMGSVKSTAADSSAKLSSITNSTEEMSVTIANIATNAEKARRVAGTAVANVNSASARVDELGAAALEISKVTDVIVEIAEQTKLLALNATIEAARAGEAGKGFAVVANEVKELALQTNNAIAEIRNKVEAMQQSTDNTITEIGAINQTINAVNAIVVNIAGAVDEQSSTTKSIVDNINQAVHGIREMSGNVSEAAGGVAAITGNVTQAADGAKLIAADIASVHRNAGGLNKSALAVKKQAAELLSLGDALREEVRKFRV